MLEMEVLQVFTKFKKTKIIQNTPLKFLIKQNANNVLMVLNSFKMSYRSPANLAQ
jgi:hypothetical protein